METKYSLTLDKDFVEYCRINNIDDVEKLAKDTFKTGFDMLKYGKKLQTILHPPLPKLSNKESLPPEKIDEVIRKTKDKINKDLYGE